MSMTPTTAQKYLAMGFTPEQIVAMANATAATPAKGKGKSSTVATPKAETKTTGKKAATGAKTKAKAKGSATDASKDKKREYDSVIASKPVTQYRNTEGGRTYEVGVEARRSNETGQVYYCLYQKMLATDSKPETYLQGSVIALADPKKAIAALQSAAHKIKAGHDMSNFSVDMQDPTGKGGIVKLEYFQNGDRPAAIYAVKKVKSGENVRFRGAVPLFNVEAVEAAQAYPSKLQSTLKAVEQLANAQ